MDRSRNTPGILPGANTHPSFDQSMMGWSCCEGDPVLSLEEGDVKR